MSRHLHLILLSLFVAVGAMSEEPVHVHDPVWSPDGKSILYYGNAAGNFDVYRVDLESGNVEQVTDHESNDGSPAWSPDGKTISFSSNRDGNGEIYTLHLPTGQLTRLTDNDDSDGAHNWSPSGTQIAFEARRDGNKDIYIMDADGGNERRFTNHEANDFRPAWCEDGYRIVFQSKRDGSYQLYSKPVDGGEVTRLTEGPGQHANPDCGRKTGRILHLQYDEGERSTIHVMSADGSKSRALTAGPSDLHPRWSPDETKIVFYSDRDGALGIYVMEIESGKLKRVDG